QERNEFRSTRCSLNPKRRPMRAVAILIVGLVPAASVRADVKIDDETKKSVAKGLAWLAAKQNPDGSWSDGRYLHNTAVTSFALLPFMSQGHLPHQGQYGSEVCKGARFLMASAQNISVTDRETGKRLEGAYLVGTRGGNMYGHGMATLALAELWGQTGDDDIRPILKKATDLIINTQNPQGGWRYEPQPSGADISVTIMQVMALRAAKNAGLHVPDVTLEKAIKYIKMCYSPSDGGFSYMPGSRGPGFARTAAGSCVLFLTRNAADKKREAEIDKMMPKAVEYLKRHFDD